MVTRFCVSKIHSYFRKRNFLNQLTAVQDGKPGSDAKVPVTTKSAWFPPSKQTLPCDRGYSGLCPYILLVLSEAEHEALQTLQVRKRQARVGLSMRTGRGCGTVSIGGRVGLGGALLTSKLLLPPAQTGAGTQRTPFCSCANYSGQTVTRPLSPTVIPHPLFTSRFQWEINA